MSKLSALLKNQLQHDKKPSKLFEEDGYENIGEIPKIDKIAAAKASTKQISQKQKKSFGGLEPEDYASVLEMVNELPDEENMTRREIIIGKFGTIKNPKTGENFRIPNVSPEDDDYIYNYASTMMILVQRPADFEKIMNWE